MRSKGGSPAKVAWLVIAGLLVFMGGHDSKTEFASAAK